MFSGAWLVAGWLILFWVGAVLGVGVGVGSVSGALIWLMWYSMLLFNNPKHVLSVLCSRCFCVTKRDRK